MKKAFVLLIFLTRFNPCTAQIDLGGTVLQNTVVATNLDVPWDMAYGADGWIWFTELAGMPAALAPQMIGLLNWLILF